MKKVLILFAISCMAVALINCGKEKKDNTNEQALLAAAGMSNPLSPQQQKAITVGSSVAGSVSSSVPCASPSMASNIVGDQQRLVAGIIDNGYDPVYSSEAFSGYMRINNIKAAKPDVKLASISHAYVSGSEGSRTYTFSGNVKGVGKKETTKDISNPLYGSCSMTMAIPDSTQEVGSCSFQAGSLVNWNGSFDGTSNYTGTSTLDTTITYNGFGTWYFDWFTVLYNLKQHPPFLSLGFLTCNGFKQIYQNTIANLHKYCIIDSGDLTVHMVSTYNNLYTIPGGPISSNLDFTVTLNSLDGISIKENGEGLANTITFADVLYHYSCNFSYDPASTGSIPSGSLALTFSGKVDGIDIDESVSLSFP